MATDWKDGDRVTIADRAVTADDVKSGLFYDHFRGLTGIVQKVYASGEVAVEVEPIALAEPVSHRHEDVEQAMKTKWLDGLSEEARGRLTDQERDFHLRYTVLVAEKDVQPASAGDVSIARKTSAELLAAEESELKKRGA